MKKKKKATHKIPTPNGPSLIKTILVKAAPRPGPLKSLSEKNSYAIRFADAAATLLAQDLTPSMEGIEASPKRAAKSARGGKQLDVNFSTTATGLALGISLKSVHIRESSGAKRYTHNMKRNEEELRIEAIGYHKRQPYAVMIGVLFLPVDSCDDAKTGSSSFGSWVRHLRPFSGRRDPRDDVDRFEKIYIALYDPEGTDIWFFDVETAPPMRGRPRMEGDLHHSAPKDLPRRLMTYVEFLGAVEHAYRSRNNTDFFWDDGSVEPAADDDGLDV